MQTSNFTKVILKSSKVFFTIFSMKITIIISLTGTLFGQPFGQTPVNRSRRDLIGYNRLANNVLGHLQVLSNSDKKYQKLPQQILQYLIDQKNLKSPKLDKYRTKNARLARFRNYHNQIVILPGRQYRQYFLLLKFYHSFLLVFQNIFFCLFGIPKFSFFRSFALF